ncbi:hypothetical protein N7G274_003321 [Stereocaulon virgatum]|uniref:Uncharacterized protein n=1 Tax=Stereocaulon virgatum TaxID=373712 RepID=A0ABR4AG55_9LECA
MACVNMIDVIDISSDEEENAVKKAQNSPKDGHKFLQNYPSRPQPSRQVNILANRERPNSRRRAGRPQSMNDLQPQINKKLVQKRALSEPGLSATAAPSTAETPFSSLHNTNRYQSSRSNNPEKASINTRQSAPPTQTPSSQPPNTGTLRLSEQPSTSPPNRKRKPTNVTSDLARKRAKPSPAPPTPHRLPERTSVPVISSIDLWSIPQYQEPITIRDDAHEVPPAIPNTTANDAAKTPVSTAQAASHRALGTVSSSSATSAKSNPCTPSSPRSRRTMWTCAQLANFATAIDTSLDIDSFAAANNKTPQQVKETLGFLVMKPIFEYAEEGQKIARKFHKEMREHQKEIGKVMRKVHRREKREGCWSAEGMPAKEGKMEGAKRKDGEKEKGGRSDGGDGDREDGCGGKKDGGKGKRKGKGPLEMALAGKEKE